MATIHIDTDTNLADVSWNDGDYICIRNGATLTIDSNPPQGKHLQRIYCYEEGTLNIVNTSTNAADVIELMLKDYILLDFRSKASLIIDGELVEIGTSDGTNNQQFTVPYIGNYNNLPGVYVENDFGLLQNQATGWNNQVASDIRMFHYDKSNNIITLDRYIPANGTKLFIPNIRIGRTNNDKGYIKIETAKYFRGSKFIANCGFLPRFLQSPFELDYVVVYDGSYTFKGVVNITNLLAIGKNAGGGLYSRYAENGLYENCLFFGESNFDSNKNLTFKNCIFSQGQNAKGMVFSKSSNLLFEDCKTEHIGLKIQTCADVKVNNLTVHNNEDTNNRYEVVEICDSSRYVSIDGLHFTNDARTKYKSGVPFIYFSRNNYRCEVRNLTWNMADATNAGYKSRIINFTDSNIECGIYNAYIDNADGHGDSLFVVDQSCQNVYVTNCGTSNNCRDNFGAGLNPVFKAVTMRNAAPYWDYLIGSGVYLSQDYLGDWRIVLRAGMATGDTMVVSSDSVYPDVSSRKVWLPNIGDYFILRFNKYQELRRIKSIDSINPSTSNNNNFDFYFSVDNEQTWIALADFIGYEPPNGVITALSMKCVCSVSDEANQFNDMRMGITYDDALIDYEPYFFWSKFVVENLPDDGDFWIAYQIGDRSPVHKKVNASKPYIDELWRENPDMVSIRIRKYDYTPYETNSYFNRDEVKFFYTGTKIVDLSKTYDEALNLSGVQMIPNPGYSEHDKYWNWTLDCGGNDLNDVYLYLKAVTSTNDDFWGTNGLDWWLMLEKDGDGYASVWGGVGNGVRVINYAGLLTKEQSDDGSYYVPSRFASLRLKNLVPNSEIRITSYIEDNNVEIIDQVEDTTDHYTYSYIWTEDKTVTVTIFHPRYLPVVRTVNLTVYDQEIIIEQEEDRNFYDPSAPRLDTPTFSMKRNTDKVLSIDDIYAGSTFEGGSFNTANVDYLEITIQPSNGTLTDNGDGTFTYTPSTDWTGVDTFEFMPHYTIEYAGIIKKQTVTINVLRYYSDKQLDNIVIIGDSILEQLFGATRYWSGTNGRTYFTNDFYFHNHFKVAYNRDVNLYQRAIGGYTIGQLIDNFDGILPVDFQELEGNTLVYCFIGTNDMATDRYGTDEDKKEHLARIYDGYTTLKQMIQDRFPNWYIVFDENIAISYKWDSNPDHVVFDEANLTWAHEELGSAQYNYSLGITEPDKDLRAMIRDLIDAEFKTSYNSTLLQLYNWSRNHFIWTGEKDDVHPTMDLGADLFHINFIDTLLLYFEYGVKPVEIDQNGWNDITINLSDSQVIEDKTKTDGGTGVRSTEINNWDITANSTITNVIDWQNNGTGVNIELYDPDDNSAIPTIVDINPSDIKRFEEGFFTFHEYMYKAWEIRKPWVIKFTGLTDGHIYRFQFWGTTDKTLGGPNSARFEDSRKGRITCLNNDRRFDLEITHYNMEDSNGDTVYYSNAGQAYTFQWVADGDTAEFEIRPINADGITYLNVIRFWKVSEGV